MRPDPHSPEDVLAFLKDSTFLGLLSDPALQALVPKGRVKKYAPGDVICRRGDQVACPTKRCQVLS